MEILRALSEVVLPHDTSNVSILIQEGNLHIEWDAVGRHYQICFVDCIYFEWIDNQESFGLNGISVVEESSLLERLLGESRRFRDIRTYEMHHFQLSNLYGRNSNIVCHSIE